MRSEVKRPNHRGSATVVRAVKGQKRVRFYVSCLCVRVSQDRDEMSRPRSRSLLFGSSESGRPACDLGEEPFVGFISGGKRAQNVLDKS